MGTNVRKSFFTSVRPTRVLKIGLLAATAFTLCAGAASAYNGDPDYLTYDGGAIISPDGPSGSIGAQGPVSSSSGSVGLSFQGISQYDTRAFGRGFIPPDTMGAVGATQYMEFVNGATAVYDKASGARTSLVSDLAFWAAAGQSGAFGDSRVMYDNRSQRWVALSFAATTDTIQIAVSDTSNALGGWKSTSFLGYSGIADFPTLAIDSKAIYIGTNNFNAAGTAFDGVTLNVISRGNLFGPGGPTTTSLKQFFTSTAAIVGGDDRGFAIQGVNQIGSDSGKIIAVGANNFGSVRYDVNNPGTAGATETAATLLSPGDAYDPNRLARQPYTTGTGATRTIDPSDDRIGSAAWEQHGKIYSVHTITETGTDHTEVQWQVVDAATNAILATGKIGGNGDGYDYYQGSIAVNDSGQVVIGYDRSGSNSPDGKISIFADTFNSLAGGGLTNTGRYLLKVSDSDSYHNGSLDGQAATGRQRWGDYSAVSLDPSDREKFWIIGEFAREPNNAANGHPGGTGGTRWGTWISQLTLSAVPEPATWAMMLVGFGVVGGALRRRTAKAAA